MNQRTLGPTPDFVIRHHRDRAVIAIVGALAVLVGCLLVVGVAVTL